MGEWFSHAHAACLAAQLPRGSRCRVAENPREEWDESTWMLWRVEHGLSMLAWGLSGAPGQPPGPLDYPGCDEDRAIEAARLQDNKRKVDEAFGIGE